MSNILVAGSMAYDHSMSFEGEFKDFLIPNDFQNFSVSFQTKKEDLYFGGCAGNIAYTCSLLGDTPHIVSVVGNDFKEYEDWLKKNKISTKFIQVDKNNKTASAYMLTDSNHNQLTIFSVGAMQDISELTKFDFDKLPKVDYAIVSPGFPFAMLYFAQSFMERKIPYIVDPGQNITALSSDALISLIDTSEGFIVNEYEGEIISKELAMPLSKVAKRTSFLVVTKGAEGADIHTDGKIIHVPSIKSYNVLDVTGCGDSFRSGFIHGVTSGETLERACQVGHVTASFAIEQKGTQKHAFTKDQFKARFKKYYG